MGSISLCRGRESNTPPGAKSNTPLGAKSSTPLGFAGQCAAGPGNRTSAAVRAVGLQWLGLYALAVGRVRAVAAASDAPGRVRRASGGLFGTELLRVIVAGGMKRNTEPLMPQVVVRTSTWSRWNAYRLLFGES